VRDLVVGHREGARLRRIEQLPVLLAAHADKARLAQRAVDVNGAADGNDAVLGQQDDAASAPLRLVSAASAIQRLERMLVAGPQNSNSGKGPRRCVSSSRNSEGCA
jgi:hypothetical protein